jgi:hypothetical protein
MSGRYSFHRNGETGAFRVWQILAATRAGLASQTRVPLGEPVASRPSRAL